MSRNTESTPVPSKMVATRGQLVREAQDVETARRESLNSSSQQDKAAAVSEKKITLYLALTKTASGGTELAFKSEKPRSIDGSIVPKNPPVAEAQKATKRAPARRARAKASLQTPIFDSVDRDDEDWSPAASVSKQVAQVATRRSKRSTIKKTTSKIRKTLTGRIEKSSETKKTSSEYKKTVVVKQNSKGGHTEKTTTTKTVSEERTKTVKQTVAVSASSPKQRRKHLKVVLRGIDFSKLSQSIRDQDWRAVQQRRRLENYQGRYLPPPIQQCHNRYNFKFDHNPFSHAGFQAPSTKIMWEVYRAMERDLKDSFGKDCFLDQPDQTTNELLDGPMHLTSDLTVDNIVKVILSISTENSLAIRQHAQLCSKFTYTMSDGSESTGTIPNYHKMRECSAEELIRALNVAGHHNIRQKAFHGILNEIYDQNVKRLQPGETTSTGNPVGASDFVPGLLSMDYLKEGNLGKQERFDLLVKFPQIAVKTGCCLLAFNLKIPVFVVDTHVHNMVRDLAWVPEYCTDADKACMFLDQVMPAELKFGLHQAFWHHRINCVRCMPRANPKSQAYQDRVCPLEHLMKRDLKPLRRSAKDEGQAPGEGEDMSKPKKEHVKKSTTKKLPGTVTFLKLHHKQAAEAGYVLRKILVDDDFGDGSRQNKDKSARYFWGLKEFSHANDTIVRFEDALAAAGLSSEEHEALFAKKARARKAKAQKDRTDGVDGQLFDDDETLDDLLEELWADEDPDAGAGGEDGDIEMDDAE